MAESLPKIAVLGASGLIGEAVTRHLKQAGFVTLAVARQFSGSQRVAFADDLAEVPIVALGVDALAELLIAEQVDVVVNCVGVLQDGPGGAPGEVHVGFIQRLLDAMGQVKPSALLVQISVPGDAGSDQTEFSQTKRLAEAYVVKSNLPHVILRPGFVIAPAAYGGSALMRALAVLPFGLPEDERARPFSVIHVDDICLTICRVVERWRGGERSWSSAWDMMGGEAIRVGEVVDGFRSVLGGPRVVVSMPNWLMRLGALAGDLAGIMGWRPPIRSTALAEMRRGVTGDPAEWITATGIQPRSLKQILQSLAAPVQEKWFARLYLLKGLIIACLSVFWISSGLIALTLAFGAAVVVLTPIVRSAELAGLVTVLTSLIDIGIGLAIGFRKVSRVGLMAGIGVSISYVLGAAILAPALWGDPLGAMVKTVPVIVLMLVALAIWEDR